MSDDRAAAIRDYLARMDKDPVIARQYSRVASRWEQYRLAQHRGKSTAGDDVKMRELGHLMRGLQEKLGMGDSLPTGFLPGDPCRLLYDTWHEAAELWHG